MALRKFLNGRFKPVKLRTAMVLIITISLIITSTAIAAMLLSSHKRLLEKRSIATIKDSLSIASSTIDNYIESEIKAPIYLISKYDEFIDLLNENRGQTLRDSLVMTYLLNEKLLDKSTTTVETEQHIILENKEGRIYNLSSPMTINNEDIDAFMHDAADMPREAYYGRFLEPMSSKILTGNQDETWMIPYVQNIIALTPYSYEGKVVVAIPESTLADLISDNSLTENGFILIVSPEGNVITCTNRAGRNNLWHEEIAYWKSSGSLNGDNHYIDRKNGTVNVSLTDSETGWTYISISDLDAIYGPINRELAIYMLLSILIIGAAIFAVLRTSRHINEPFENLKKSMHDVIKTRDFTVQLEERGPSDVRELTRAYNVLCSDMDHMIWNEYELRRQTQLAEFDALVTQINPHFLANTLDSIVWKAYMADVPEIAEMASGLGELFSLALNGGNAMTSLGNEIRYAEAYIALQNYRYDGKIILSVLDNTGENIDEITVPKLIIQPIIENSLKHGFKSTMKDFTVTISLENIDDALEITISDTGTGMDAETLERTKAKLIRKADGYDHGKAEYNFKKGEGVGMVNVNQRLRLYYGKEAGLAIISTGPEGTVISLNLPLIINRDGC